MGKIIWVIAILILIALVGYGVFIFKSKKDQKDLVVPMPNSYKDCVEAGGAIMKPLPSQCAIGGQVFVKEINEENNIELKNKVMKNSENVFTGVDSFELKDVTGGDAKGKAWIVVSDGKTFHKVDVRRSLPALENGDFYEGWLVKKAPTLDFFSTGKMYRDDETGNWLLDYEAEGDKSDYPEVVITLESDDGNPAPAKHILEGSNK